MSMAIRAITSHFGPLRERRYGSTASWISGIVARNTGSSMALTSMAATGRITAPASRMMSDAGRSWRRSTRTCAYRTSKPKTHPITVLRLAIIQNSLTSAPMDMDNPHNRFVGGIRIRPADSVMASTCMETATYSTALKYMMCMVRVCRWVQVEGTITSSEILSCTTFLRGKLSASPMLGRTSSITILFITTVLEFMYFPQTTRGYITIRSTVIARVVLVLSMGQVVAPLQIISSITTVQTLTIKVRTPSQITSRSPLYLLTLQAMISI